MKKKFILPRRFLAFACAFALTFTSFTPLSVRAESEEEQVQETVTEETHDDCCDHHEEETNPQLEEVIPPAEPQVQEEVQVIIPTETLEIIPEIPQDIAPNVEQEEAGLSVSNEQNLFALFSTMPLMSATPNGGGEDPKGSGNNHKHKYENVVDTVKVDPTCESDGYTYDVLQCSHKGCDEKTNGEKTVLPKTGHTSIAVDGKRTSCTEEGMTSGHKCSVCDTILDGCQTIPKTRHQPVNMPDIPATCQREGYTGLKICLNCQQAIGEPVLIPKVDHDYTDTAFNKPKVVAPTCTEQGYTEHFCRYCKEASIKDNFTDPAHKPVTVEKVDATCTEKGHEAGTKCSVCGEILSGCEEIPAAHKSVPVAKVDATCTEKGHEAGTKCSVCDETLTGCEEINPKGHSFGLYISDKNATCVSKGTKTATCIREGCSEKDTKQGDSYGDHQWENDYTVDIQPTCMQPGSKSIHCALCDEKDDVTEIEPVEHNLKWVTIEEPTCTEKGSHKQVCKNDGCTYETEPSDMNELGHDWATDYTVDTDPTCLNYGWKSRHCTRCEAWTDQQRIEKIPHDYEFLYETEPNCELDGRMYYKCKVCEDSYSEKSADKLGHDFEWVIITPATCTEDGSRKQVCQREDCNAYTAPETIPAPGHQFGEWYVTEEATCQKAGLKRRDCTKCSHYETEDIPKVGHTYVKADTIAPTCTEQGYDLALCKWCNKERHQHLVDPLGHDFSVVKEVVKPTCLKDGYTVYKCSRCEETENRDTVPALNHDYGEWRVTKEPTCKELGSQRRDCVHEGCNSYQTQAIPVVNHSFTEVKEVVEPTCLEKGYTVYKCKWCDETEIRDYVDALDHDYEEEWQVETPATCTENGTQIKHCRRPGCKWVQRTIIPKTGHNYEEEWKVIKEPTCQELGVKAQYCKNEGCHNYLSNAINKVGHSFTEVKEVVEPTCTEKGYTVYKCKWCEETETRDYIDALDHDYEEEWQVETPATCTENGTQIKHCRRPGCKWVQRTIILKTGHDYEEEWKVIKEPTCQELGVKAQYCKNEGCHNYLSNAIDKVGHSFTVPQKTVKPTCTEKGYTVYKCKWCEETEIRDYVDPLNHDYDDWFTVTDPTCQADGEERHDCKNCEAYETRPIAKLDHHVFSEFVKKVEPTCTADGYTTYKCKWCEETENRETVPAKGHDFDNWFTVTDPTCQAEGLERHDCKNCEHYETRPIAKVDHKYSVFVKKVDPTCEVKGYTVYKCTWCEKTETRDYTNALGHKHVTDPAKSATCTSDGYTEKEYCERCGKVFRDRDTTKATGHSWGPEKFENIVFPTVISLGGYDSVRYCWNCGCRHAVHVTLPMIILPPVKPLPTPKPVAPVIPKQITPVVPKDDPLDIIDRSNEDDPGEVTENAEDVKDVADDSSKSEEVVGEKSDETSEEIVTDNSTDEKKKTEVTTQQPVDDEEENSDYMNYIIIALCILLLLIIITFLFIYLNRRKDDQDEEEMK